MTQGGAKISKQYFSNKTEIQSLFAFPFQELMNSGKERYVCFIHDFNLCRVCVQKSLKCSKPVLNEANATPTVPPTAPSGGSGTSGNKTTKVSIDCELPTRPNRNLKTRVGKQSVDENARQSADIETAEDNTEESKKNSTWSRSKSYAHAINT